ncbi:MAG: cation:proton antiporter [Actinomycetota bacterium]
MSITGVLFDILVVLVAAKLAAEVSERIGVPAVVGEIAAGVLVGRSVLGIVGHDEVLAVLAELGVILLLVEVGMEMDLGELKRVGRSALLVAVLGVALPFAGGFVAAEALGVPTEAAVFLGASLTATSIGITARVFGDLKALASVEARTVLGAAIADDVMGLLLLTIVTGTGADGSVSAGGIARVGLVALVVLGVSLVVGGRVAPWFFEQVQRLARSTGTLVALSLAFILVFALVAEAAGLAPIIGAFIAGVTLARSTEADRIKNELASVGHLFIPVFFLQIGIDVDASRFGDPGTLTLAGALMVVAVAGKVLSGWGAAGVDADKAAIGLGMLPRGEVGLIFAGLGLREGLLDQNEYGALLLVVFATTLLAPPLLRWRLARRGPADAIPVAFPASASRRTLTAEGGTVELTAAIPPGRALDVALDAALLLAPGDRPGPLLLEHLGSLTAPSLRWDEASIAKFFRVLGEGNVRSWRFLETSGVLDRVLPELSEALRKRRSDRHELDPTQALRWPILERLQESVRADRVVADELGKVEKRERLLLAVVALDAGVDEREAVKLGRRLASRFSLGARAEQEVALVCGSAQLLLAALARPDALEETSVLEMAAHLGRPEVARDLYLISVGSAVMEPWQRARLDELHRLVQTVLQAGGADRASLSVIDRKRRSAAAACGSEALAEWIVAAPPSHVVVASDPDLVRHAGLLQRAAETRTTCIEVFAADGRWRVELASMDRRGLLAHTTGALASCGCNVETAFASTWPRGIALQSFLVSCPSAPDAQMLQTTLAGALERPLQSVPIPDADIRFDDSGSPWATLCEIRAPDREGLLHAVSAAFAVSEVNVRSARAVTEEGRVVDRFELVGRDGAKVPPAIRSAIAERIRDGVELRPRRFVRRRSSRT